MPLVFCGGVPLLLLGGGYVIAQSLHRAGGGDEGKLGIVAVPGFSFGLPFVALDRIKFRKLLP